MNDVNMTSYENIYGIINNTNKMYVDKNNKFVYIFDKKICEIDYLDYKIPKETKFLIMDKDYQKELSSRDFPEDLVYLDMSKYNKPISYLDFPENLICLILDNKMHKNTKIPRKLKILCFRGYNNPLKTINFPEDLHYLKFGSFFNPRINKYELPSNLKELNLGNDFNQIFLPDSFVNSGKYNNNIPIYNYISIKRNNNIDILENYNIFPDTLEKLEIGNSFNQSLTVCLKTEEDNMVVVSLLPINLIYLKLGDEYNKPLINLPNSLEELVLGKKFGNITDSLYKLSKKKCNIIREKNKIINLDNLPINLRKLKIDNYFNKTINNLPDSLTELEIGFSFNQKIEKFPNSLKILNLGDSFDQSLDNLPHGLEILKVGNSFDQLLKNLPTTLISLDLGFSFNSELEHLPCSLKNLKIGINFDRNLDNLPNNLETLQ